MPSFGPDVILQNPAFIHSSAQLYGRITVQENASVWCNVVGRAENFEIVIGPYSNVQDFVMMHVGISTGTYIGSHCSITHRCTIHGCQIGNNCLIGISATIMDGCEIGDNCIIGGHTFLPENTKIPANSVVVGVPGAIKRTQNNYIRNRMNAFYYYRNALAYRSGQHREWDQPEFAAAMAEELRRLQVELSKMEGG